MSAEAAAAGTITPMSPGTRVRAGAIRAASWALARVPESVLIGLADVVGELWYRRGGVRRERATRNLRRVAGALAASGRGSALARQAAADPVALERLVRRTFCHAVRYYLEVARTGGRDPEAVVARLHIETPDVVEHALAGGPMVLVGAHFGAIEVPIVYLARRAGHPFTAPMEELADPALRDWFVRSRRRVGVRPVPIADARRELAAAIAAGQSVGLVAERDLTGGGRPTPFFGAPAPMPIGPALLCLETGTPMYVGGARRTRDGRYLGRLIAIPAPPDGTRRARLDAMMASMAAAFESILADAPEQWWGAFHPIWPDLEASGR